MNINRHNYEEFFILYWDNELTAEQKKLVEDFVRENNDLQEEFRLFGETRFTPDQNIAFEEKDLLLNDEHSFINPSNYREQLLSYIDDELNAVQKKSIETFTGNHPSVQLELSILRKTKLLPDTDIVFPDKSILYRKEERVSVITMTWRRVAVAAAILLMAGLFTFRLINNNKRDGTAGLATVNPIIEKKEIRNNNTEVSALQNQEVVQLKPAKIKKAITPETKNISAENLLAAISPENKNNLPKEKKTAEQQLLAENTPPAHTDEPGSPDIRNKNMDALVISEQDKKNSLFDNNTVTERPSPSYTVYNPSADSKENADKGGLKGFLRKATRMFERRTKMQTITDDNKLLVGVFAVSLK